MTYLFYYGSHVLGILLALGYLVWVAPRFGLDRFRTGVSAALAMAGLVLVMKVIYFAFTGVFGGENTVTIVLFVPVAALVAALVSRQSAAAFIEAAAPVICIIQGIAKFGCQAMGCCQSWLHVDWGFYNYKVRDNLFPIQSLEAVVALAVAVVLIVITLRSKWQTGGFMMPLMLVLFGFTRFWLEFLRDNHKVLWGLSKFSLWSVALVVAGCVWIAVLAIRRRREATTI